MKLSEYGLYKIDSKGNEKSILINSEVDIYENLLLKYIPPENR